MWLFWYILLSLALPALSWAQTTYYVSLTGNDSNTCTQAQSSGASAKRTVDNAAQNCLSGGDTLIIQAGTYSTASDSRIDADLIPSGTSGNPTIIRCETLAPFGATPQCRFQPNDSNLVAVVRFDSNARSWITFDSLRLDGINMANAQGARCFESVNNVNTSNIVLQNSWCHDFGSDAVVVGIGNTFTRITYNRIFNITENHDLNCQNDYNPGIHGAYIRGDDTTFSHNYLQCISGNGLQVVYGSGQVNRGTVNFNRIHDVAQHCIFGESDSTGHQHIGNVVSNCGKRGLYVRQTTCYNTTIETWGTQPGSFEAILDCPDVRNTIFKNAGGDPRGVDGTNPLIEPPDTYFTDIASARPDLTLTTLAVNAIDQGGAAPGVPCNGPCDIGGYETFGRTAGTVDGVNVVLTFDGANAPFLAPNGCTGVTFGGFACGATCSVVQPQAGNTVNITTSCPAAQGEATTITFPATWLTDSTRYEQNQGVTPETNGALTNNTGPSTPGVRVILHNATIGNGRLQQ